VASHADTDADPDPDADADPDATPTPTPTASVAPTATPTASPPPTATPTPTPSPTGGVLGQTATPATTLPPTDALSTGGGSGGEGWRMVLLALAAILAVGLLVTPATVVVRTKTAIADHAEGRVPAQLREQRKTADPYGAAVFSRFRY
jgi:hypothetical protein